MSRTRKLTASGLGRASMSALVLIALGGWGTAAYTMQSAAEAEQQLHGQVASLQEYQVQYLSERRKTEEAAAEAARLSEQLSATRQELDRASKEREQVQAELAGAKAQLSELQQARATQPQAARAPLIDVTPRPAPQDVKAAQEALNELGYGPLKADGALGTKMREAIEKYQRDKDLTVTGELYAETLQLLLRPSGAMAAQDEP